MGLLDQGQTASCEDGGGPGGEPSVMSRILWPYIHHTVRNVLSGNRMWRAQAGFGKV